jgi:hypothetical protein
VKKNKIPAAAAAKKQRKRQAAKARRARRAAKVGAIVARRLGPLTKLVNALKTENDRLNRQLNFVPAAEAAAPQPETTTQEMK